MEFYFSATAQALLDAGKLQYMVKKTGEVLPILVDAKTHRVVEIAKLTGNSLNPFLPVKAIIEAAQMYQIHRGFQKTYQMIEAVQQSIGVLQTTTAIVGCGVAITGVLSAVNLYQTLQLKKEVQALRKDLNNGFLDLKQVLKGQHTEVLALIEQKAFEERKRELERAYAKFAQALKLVEFAIEMDNTIARDNHLANAVQAMSESLAIYRDSHLMSDMNAAGKLRRAECAWTIQQMIAYVFQLQDQPNAAKLCLMDLQNGMQQDSLLIAQVCESQAELDFIFPELVRIQQHDLPALKLLQTQLNIVQALPPSELKGLPNLSECVVDVLEGEVLEVPEELSYAELRSTSNFNSLRDQLRFLIKPELRHDYESTIAQRAKEVGYPAIAQSNLEEASDQTVANLFWYLKHC